MELEWTLRREAGVALVAARLRNETGLDRRVRLRNRLAGPVLPPRTEGVAEAGWDRDGATVRVPAGGTVAVGYACPAAGQRADPPLVVADVGPPADESVGVAHARRRLGDPRPPRAVVADAVDGGNSSVTPGERPVESEPDRTATSERDGGTQESEAWLATIRERVDAARKLEGASVTEAAAVLESTDEVGDVADLETALAADERALRRAGGEAAALADRVAQTDPPVAALGRLA